MLNVSIQKKIKNKAFKNSSSNIVKKMIIILLL